LPEDDEEGVRAVNPLLLANGGLVVTVLVWGTPIPLFDILLERWDPVLLAMLRYLLALPVLLVLLWLVEPRRRLGGRLRPPGVSWGRLALLGGVGMAGFAVPFLVGLRYSDPVTVAVLAATSPVIAALVAWAWLGERPGHGIGLGIALALAGGLLTRLDLSAAGGGLRLEGGEPLVLIALVCWSWYSIAAQRWLAGCSQLHLTSVTVLPATAIMALLYGLLLWLGLVAAPPAAPAEHDWLLVVWLSVSTVAIGVLTWNLGVKHLGVVVASMYLNLIPVVAVLSAVALGAEARPEQLAGGLLVLTGVVQAQVRRFAALRAGAQRR